MTGESDQVRSHVSSYIPSRLAGGIERGIHVFEQSFSSSVHGHPHEMELHMKNRWFLSGQGHLDSSFTFRFSLFTCYDISLGVSVVLVNSE